MPEYKFYYFNIRGKGELVRLALAAAGVDFQDIRYKYKENPGEEWNEEAKAGTPLGQLPVLEIDGKKFCQQTSLARFVAKQHGLMGENDLQAFKVDMLVETVWPDVALKCGMMMYETDEVKKESMKEKLAESLPVTLEKIAKWIEGDFVLGSKISLADLAIIDAVDFVVAMMPGLELPKAIEQVMKNTKESPLVKKWLESRPVTQF